MSATITPQELAGLRSSEPNTQLLDVRTPIEFRQGHVPFARNRPLDELTPEVIKEVAGSAAGQPIYVICRTGGRGRKACERFRESGIDAINVEGGTLGWEGAGLPLDRAATNVISLERQVRIAAGALVLLGVAGGALIHPALYGMAAFVGAGLVFAGVTDTCGMGLMLARMPWNRVADSSNRPVETQCCER